MKKQNHLGTDSILSLVFQLALPSMFAQLCNVLYSIIDRVYIGHIKDTGALCLAGAGVCGPIVTLLSSFGTWVGLGGSILMAMKLGDNKQKQAKQILANSFLLLVSFSLILTVIFLVIKDQLLLWFGASSAIFPYASSYMTIYTLGTFFSVLSIGLTYFITCQGFPMISMRAVVIGALTNIILDPIFIFYFDLGIKGAAIATVIAQIASCSCSLCFLFGNHVPIKISFKGYDRHIITHILSLGLSPFIILCSDSILIIAMNAVLQKSGGSQGDILISSVTIIQSFMMLITAPMAGITGGTQAILSFNYGARQKKRIIKAEQIILCLCVLFTSIMFILSRIAAKPFVQIFTRDQELIQISIQGIKIFTLCILPLAFQYTFVDGLTALGCTRSSLTLSLTRKLMYLLFTIVLPLLFVPLTTFYAEPLTDLLSAVITSIMYLKIMKRLDLD